MTKLLGYTFIASALLFSLGCGGKSKPAAPANSEVTVSGALTIAPLSFYEGDELGMKLAADGTLTIKNKSWSQDKGASEEWQTLGQLTADGKMLVAGEVKAQIGADGRFTSSDGKKGDFKLEGETLIAGDKQISIDEKGMFVGTNPGMKPMRVEGATDAGSRRTALLLLALISGGGPSADQPAVEAGASVKTTTP